jgi:hypothetical protein
MSKTTLTFDVPSMAPPGSPTPTVLIHDDLEYTTAGGAKKLGAEFEPGDVFFFCCHPLVIASATPEA